MKITWDSKLLITASVLVCSSICLSLAVLSHVFSAYQFAAAREISINWFPSVDAIGKIRIAMFQLRRVEARAAISNQDCSVTECGSGLIAARQALFDAEARYARLVTPGDESLMFESYKIQRQDYLDSEVFVISSPRGKAQASQRFLSESQQLLDAALETLNKLSEFNSKEGLRAHRTATIHHDRALLCIDLLNMLLLLMAGSMVFALYKYVEKSHHHRA